MFLYASRIAYVNKKRVKLHKKQLFEEKTKGSFINVLRVYINCIYDTRLVKETRYILV